MARELSDSHVHLDVGMIKKGNPIAKLKDEGGLASN